MSGTKKNDENRIEQRIEFKMVILLLKCAVSTQAFEEVKLAAGHSIASTKQRTPISSR
jgi:hypothetical protein